MMAPLAQSTIRCVSPRFISITHASLSIPHVLLAPVPTVEIRTFVVLSILSPGKFGFRQFNLVSLWNSVPSRALAAYSVAVASVFLTTSLLMNR
jgi:hypothetical protein